MERPSEQKEDEGRLQEVVELLVASGYFRARIKGLSPFDKVVGGMVWCMSVCSYEVDVDIFKENASIGHKIALTEKLVECLSGMKCPHPLQPHQIQGCDFVNIFPVVQWLVLRAVERRQGSSDGNRLCALHHFHNQHSFLTPYMTSEDNRALSCISKIEKSHGVQRKWRRVGGSKGLSEDKKIHSALLEYGRRDWMAYRERADDDDDDDDGDGVDDDTKAASSSSSSSAQQSHTQQVVELMEEMTPVDSNKQISDRLVQQKRQHRDDVTSSLINLQGKLSKNFHVLSKQKKELEEEEEQVKERFNKLSLESERIGEVEREAQELQEQAANKKMTDELSLLAARREELRQQAVCFKRSCDEEKRRIENSMKELKQHDVTAGVLTQQLSLMEQELQEGGDKLSKLKTALARKNRDVALLQRSLDDVPSRPELSQYHARFVELHNQVAQKHKETKQFFNVHNTADDTRMYLDKEANLLNSICDNFEKGTSSDSGKEAFMSQLKQIVQGVLNNHNKVELKQEEAQARLRVMERDLQRHQSQEASYYAAVKLFQQECSKQEALKQKLKTLQEST